MDSSRGWNVRLDMDIWSIQLCLLISWMCYMSFSVWQMPFSKFKHLHDSLLMTSCSLKTLVQQVFHVSNPFESQSLVDGCRGSISLRITIDLLLSKGFMPFSNWWIESLRWHISAHAQRLSTKRKNRSGYMRSSLTFRFFRLHY